MSTINDLWVTYLKAEGYVGETFSDLIYDALITLTSETAKLNIEDLWHNYLETEGFDSLYTYLGDKGYTGTLNDRLKASLLAGDVFTATGPITCAYPFDATDASGDFTGGNSTSMTLTNDSQTMSCVLTGTPNHEFEAFPVNLWTERAGDGGLTFTPTNEILGMQLNLDTFPKHSGGGSGFSVAYRINLAFLKKDFTDRIYLCAEATDDGRAYPSLRNNAGAYVWEGLSWVDDILAMGLYHNPTTDQWGIITRTVTSAVTTTTDHGYIAALDSYGMTGETYGFLEVFETTEAADVTGETVQVSVVTESSLWDLPFPANTTGICSAIAGYYPATCDHPLDATEAALISAGFDGRLALSLADQQTTYTIQPELGIAESYAAAEAGALTNVGAFDISTGGPYGIEIVVTLPDFTHSGTPANVELIESEMVMSDPLQSQSLPPVILETIMLDDETALVGMSMHEGIALGTYNILAIQSVDIGTTHIYGLWIDPDNSTVRLWDNGVEATLITNTIPAGWNGSNLFLAATAAQYAADPDNAEGLAVVSRFITDRADITTSFPAGTTDICGNLIS